MRNNDENDENDTMISFQKVPFIVGHALQNLMRSGFHRIFNRPTGREVPIVGAGANSLRARTMIYDDASMLSRQQKKLQGWPVDAEAY